MGHPLFTSPLSKKVWDAASVGSNGQSATFDSFGSPFVTAWGHASAATTITLMLSNDGATFYAGPNVVLSGAGDFCLNANIGAEFLALQSLSAATITGIIGAK